MFPARQVLVLNQADLLLDHVALLDRICDFLEIENFGSYPAGEVVFSHQHERVEPTSEKDRTFLRDVFADELRFMRQEYGFRW